MKTTKIIVCAGLIIGTLTGCSSGQPSQPAEPVEMAEVEEYSVIGQWRGKDSDKTVYYEFKEDETYVNGQIDDKGEKINEVSGTYSYSEETLTLKEKDKDTKNCQVLFENDDVMELVIKEKVAEEKTESSEKEKSTEEQKDKAESSEKGEDTKEQKGSSDLVVNGKTAEEQKDKTETKDNNEEKEVKTETKKIRLVKQVSQRKVVFMNDTGLNVSSVQVKSEKDKDFSSNLLKDTDKNVEGLFEYSFDPNLKYEIKIETKERKSQVVSQNSKKDEKEEESAPEEKEYTIKDFNAGDMNEATLKIKKDICYVEYVSLTTGEKKDTYKEPEKKEEPKPAAPSQPAENIDTSMAGTYYLQGNMNVRTGAGYNAGVITVYSAGTAVSIVGTITNPDGSIWAKLTDGTYICYRDGNGQYLGTSPPAGGGASAGTYVTLYEMNVRAGPSTSAYSFGTIPAGTVFVADEVVYGSDGSIWLRSGVTDPGYVCYQNSGGTYLAPY